MLNCDVSRFSSSFFLYSDVNSNTSLHGSKSSEFNPSEVEDEEESRPDLFEEVDEDRDNDVALNIGNIGHVRSMIAKFNF